MPLLLDSWPRMCREPCKNSIIRLRIYSTRRVRATRTHRAGRIFLLLGNLVDVNVGLKVFVKCQAPYIMMG